MAFHVGQKVTPKDNDPWERGYSNEVYPEFGVVYTIREIIDGRDGCELLFNEIHNPPKNYTEGFLESTFEASEFRPVVERKTDISIFTEMLKPSKVDA